MDHRKMSGTSSDPGNVVYRSSSRRPARVLIVEASPPWWSDTCDVLCEALDDFLSLACSLDGPCRIPLLSLYAVSRQQECLLPFAQVRGNLARLRSCVEELRAIPGEGCTRGATRGGELLQQALLDGLQQFRQHMKHTSAAGHNTSLEVTVMTSQSGRGVVQRLETGLKDADLVSLRRLLVVQILTGVDCGQDSSSPEARPADAEDCLMSGTEIELQQVQNSIFNIEMVLKAWLQDQGGDREQLHLLLPGDSAAVCIKCDVQERLISPALIHLTPNLGVKTESIDDFLPVTKGSAKQNQMPQRLKAIKTLRADGVCESVLYGLPLVLYPTTCWQLDWDEMEANNNLFHALCHTLKTHGWFLLLQMEPVTAGGLGVCSHYILQPSSALSLLLKPAASKELLLPCSLPRPLQQRPAPDATQAVQACVTQLDEEFVFNPLCLSSNLYQHLRSRGLQSQPRYPYRLQAAATRRNQLQPLEGAKCPTSRQPRQLQSRQQGTTGRARATVAPFPSSSSHWHRPPPPKASRPALTLLGSGGGQEGDSEDEISTAIQRPAL
ncbi:meiosis 1 arrest protein isoform X2 [Takifugu rubripes]|uniref:meiosis 1 arrest protein isoform X2 n=1 Tax=Takifugu rubripes TaxID=31033 RepID=UPI0011458653|nr:meiosis 1 arrest protein isoform X2 [Takifugu rubripes]